MMTTSTAASADSTPTTRLSTILEITLTTMPTKAAGTASTSPTTSSTFTTMLTTTDADHMPCKFPEFHDDYEADSIECQCEDGYFSFENKTCRRIQKFHQAGDYRSIFEILLFCTLALVSTFICLHLFMACKPYDSQSSYSSTPSYLD